MERKFVHNNSSLRDRRRELRQNQTPQEEKLWFELRHSKLGAKFKRQNSVGGYIADFYCQKYKLIIELDGKIHDSKENQEYDKIRDNYFKELNFNILRIKNEEVDSDMEKVLEKIKNIIKI